MSKLTGRKRKVTKGVDEFGDKCDTCKQVTVTRGNKKVVKKKYIDEDGTRRKLKTTYKGKSNVFIREPNVQVKQTYTIKGGGVKKKKEKD